MLCVAASRRRRTFAFVITHLRQGGGGGRKTTMVLYERYVDHLVPFTIVQFVVAVLV